MIQLLRVFMGRVGRIVFVTDVPHCVPTDSADYQECVVAPPDMQQLMPVISLAEERGYEIICAINGTSYCTPKEKRDEYERRQRWLTWSSPAVEPVPQDDEVDEEV